MQLQQELRLREFSASGGHEGRGFDSGSTAPSAPPAPTPQQRQVPLLGQPPTPMGAGSLLEGLKNLPIRRRTGSVPQAQPAVPGAGGTGRALYEPPASGGLEAVFTYENPIRVNLHLACSWRLAFAHAYHACVTGVEGFAQYLQHMPTDVPLHRKQHWHPHSITTALDRSVFLRPGTGFF